MSVPLIDISRQHSALSEQLRNVFATHLGSGAFILGPAVATFEQQLASHCHSHFALGVSSGTDALVLALMALEISPGDEVITSPFTFFASAGSIARLGAKPVFVDIDPVTFNLDPRKIEAAITGKTKAIMPVHLFGQCADMTAIMAIARKHKLKVIEDAAQAIGARDHDRPAGSIGDVGCLSFYPTKNLSALGDAGACTTNDEALHKRMAMLRVHGESKRYYHDFVGGNFRLDALQAAFLSVKLPRLDSYATHRRVHACRYHELLAKLPITLPQAAEGQHHVFNQYTVRIPGGRRDALREHLTQRSIGHQVYYPVPLHLQKCFAYLGHSVGSFPQTELACNEVLSLPIFPEMTTAEQDEVVTALRAFWS